MGTYATIADVEQYAPDATVLDETLLEERIAEAERAVDRYIGPRYQAPRDPDTGLKFVPDTLPVWQARALARATAFQVEYMERMGPEFFTLPQPSEGVTTTQASYRGKLDVFAPKAQRELDDARLTRNTGRVTGTRSRRGYGPDGLYDADGWWYG